MLKPNYEISFKRIATKVCSQQSSEIGSRTVGEINNNALNYFYSFILLDCIDSLQTNSSDFKTMNNDLNFLQKQWIY